jgi:hypothetical protein
MALMSALFSWAALGTAFGWAGFRPEPGRDEEDDHGDDDVADREV